MTHGGHTCVCREHGVDLVPHVDDADAPGLLAIMGVHKCILLLR